MHCHSISVIDHALIDGVKKKLNVKITKLFLLKKLV